MSQAIIARTADGFQFSWPDLPIAVHLSRIRESSRGTTAELVAQYQNGSGKAKILTHQTINLLSSRKRLALELDGRYKADWTSMLEQVAVLALHQLRAGEPIVQLEPTEDDRPSCFILNPLIYEKNPTIVYGPGDSLKSALGLYCALLLASGTCGPNLACSPDPWRVLFLDWEMDVQDLRGRVKLFRAGDPRLTGTVDYRRCASPLADDLAELRKVVGDGGYDVLILDSLAMAAGGQELERADAAIRFNAGLRSLNCASLIVGHTPKPQADQKERSLYGSVFFHNLCRVSWECRREGQTIGLFQRKNNLGPKHPPLGFRLAMDERSATIESADLLDEPSLAAGLPLQDQIAKELKERPGQTAVQIAAAIGAKQTSVRAALNRTKSRFLSDGKGKWECLA